MRPHVGLYFAEKLGLIAVYAALIDPDPEFIDRPGQQPVSSGRIAESSPNKTLGFG